jgi:hypothetical protein
MMITIFFYYVVKFARIIVNINIEKLLRQKLNLNKEI